MDRKGYRRSAGGLSASRAHLISSAEDGGTRLPGGSHGRDPERASFASQVLAIGSSSPNDRSSRGKDPADTEAGCRVSLQRGGAAVPGRDHPAWGVLGGGNLLAAPVPGARRGAS